VPGNVHSWSGCFGFYLKVQQNVLIFVTDINSRYRSIGLSMGITFFYNLQFLILTPPKGIEE